MHKIKGIINKFVYADMLEKPGRVVSHCGRKDGGLGIHDIECKCKALLIKTFLETSTNLAFQNSTYHTAIYQHHILENEQDTPPSLPPYYPIDFLKTIKLAKDRGNNIEKIKAKDWYEHLINMSTLEEEIQHENGTIEWRKIKCKAELKNPEVDWPKIWEQASIKRISSISRGVIWKILHAILPTQERLNRITRTVMSPAYIQCPTGETDNILVHCFINCDQSREAMDWLITLIRTMAPGLTKNDMIRLKVNPSDLTQIEPCIWLVCESLEYVWSRRKSRERVSIPELKAILKNRAAKLSSSKKYNAMGSMLLTIIG